MAELLVNQAKQFAETRPSYPQELFQFIASKTPTHDLVCDVGTGRGQGARSTRKCSKLFLPREVSASVPRTKPPSKRPRKKVDAGRPLMKELAHSRSQSDMIVFNRIKGGLRFIDGRVFRLRHKAWRQQRAVILVVLSTSKFTGDTENEEKFRLYETRSVDT
ncbi:hypothetical protein OIU84_026521 [Salix udensis]|uniref:Uncharacterized protein n=1 Tax=Salix udensis TaxID=889485 RepID=A0AAD6KME8_9ROSI|nr:hypothetical protein OIU84_026521 [Salix udensis]